MECQLCKSSPGNVHLTRIVEGEVRKATLCEDCAHAHGVKDPLSYSLLEPLLSLSADKRRSIPRPNQERRCPSCGMPESRFRSSGRLGCSECYRIFSDALQQLLKAMHKGTRHTGKIPSRLQEPPAPAGPLAQLPLPHPSASWPTMPEASPPAAAPEPEGLFKEMPLPEPPTPLPNPVPPQLIAVKGNETFTMNTVPTGPFLSPPPTNAKPSLSELKSRMEAAIQGERYEEAAQLRDQLRTLSQPPSEA